MTQGAKWKTQRRFVMKTLKDFGFGKLSLDEHISFEANEVVTKFAEQSGHDVLIQECF